MSFFAQDSHLWQWLQLQQSQQGEKQDSRVYSNPYSIIQKTNFSELQKLRNETQSIK